MLIFAIIGVVLAIVGGFFLTYEMSPKEFAAAYKQEQRIRRYIRYSKKWKTFSLSPKAVNFLVSFFKNFSDNDYEVGKGFFEKKNIYELNKQLEESHFIYLFDSIKKYAKQEMKEDFFNGLYNSHFGYSRPTSFFKFLKYNLIELHEAKENFAKNLGY